MFFMAERNPNLGGTNVLTRPRAEIPRFEGSVADPDTVVGAVRR